MIKKITFEKADGYDGWHVTVEEEGSYEILQRDTWLVPDVVGKETVEEIVNRGIKKESS